MKNTELTLNELQKKFREEKAKISEDAIKVLKGNGEGEDTAIGLFIVIVVCIAVVVSVLTVGPIKEMPEVLVWTFVFIFFAATIFFSWLLITSYRIIRKEKKAYKADASNIAAVQQTGLTLHTSLKDLFIPRLRYELTGIGLGIIDSVLFPLGDQVHYDPKLLEIPSFQIKKSIEQSEGNHSLEFLSADLIYHGEDSELPPYTDAPGYYLCIFFTEKAKMEIVSRARYFPIE